jgi:hypothetical protein
LDTEVAAVGKAIADAGAEVVLAAGKTGQRISICMIQMKHH